MPKWKQTAAMGLAVTLLFLLAPAVHAEETQKDLDALVKIALDEKLIRTSPVEVEIDGKTVNYSIGIVDPPQDDGRHDPAHWLVRAQMHIKLMQQYLASHPKMPAALKKRWTKVVIEAGQVVGRARAMPPGDDEGLDKLDAAKESRSKVRVLFLHALEAWAKEQGLQVDDKHNGKDGLPGKFETIKYTPRHFPSTMRFMRAFQYKLALYRARKADPNVKEKKVQREMKEGETISVDGGHPEYLTIEHGTRYASWYIMRDGAIKGFEQKIIRVP